MKFLFLLCSIIPNIITASTGGNCKNVCNYQIDNYWTPCLDENCPQIGELCIPKNATTCVCSKECQMCVEDLYRECGDCTDKYGYDFNKEYGCNLLINNFLFYVLGEGIEKTDSNFAEEVQSQIKNF